MKENQQQNHEGWTKKALPAAANQQQEPKPARPDLLLSPADAYALLGYLDEGLGASEEELRLFSRIRECANREIERINAGLAK